MNEGWLSRAARGLGHFAEFLLSSLACGMIVLMVVAFLTAVGTIIVLAVQLGG